MYFASSIKKFLLSIGSILVVLASLGLGLTPATARAHAAAQSLQPGTVVHAASCEQAPPQSAKDRATYSAAELARYGLPPRTPGEPFAKWAKIVRNASKRVCDYTIGASRTISPFTASPAQSLIWAGYVADESVSGQNYTEADMDYFVPCVTGTPPNNDPAGMATWIGLGGYATINMIQVGVSAYQSHDFLIYQAFVENTGGTDTGPHNIFPLNCGDHVYVKVWNGHCMYLQRLNDGKNTGNQCYGPNNDGQSAQAIAERSGMQPYFAKFGTVTFKGVGITDNGVYRPMGYHPNQVPHFYYQVYNCIRWVGQQCSLFASTPLATVGPIQDDPGNPPYDKYAVTWNGYGTPWP
jgi:Peptidase A4 family